MNITKNEPVLSTATIVAVVSALLGLVVAFWPGAVSDVQQDAILVLVGVVAPIIVAVIARNYVTPNGNVAERVDRNGAVVAGEANDIVTVPGTEIRRLGEPAAHPDSSF